MSDGAGEDSRASKDVAGELGAGTGSGDGDQCGGSLDWEMLWSRCSMVMVKKMCRKVG